MTTWPENRRYELRRDSSPTGCTRECAVGLCDPVASTAAHRSASGAFADTVHAQGLAPCLFTVASEASDEERAQGSHGLRIAEEAHADLPTLDLVGKSRQDVRTALNQRASSAY